MRRSLIAGVVGLALTGIAIAALAKKRGPSNEVLELCAGLPLRLERDAVDRHFRAHDVARLGSAGYPGEPGEIMTWGTRGSGWLSIAGWCSVQFSTDGHSNAVAFIRRTGVRAFGFSLFSTSDASNLQGSMDTSAFEWK